MSAKLSLDTVKKIIDNCHMALLFNIDCLIEEKEQVDVEKLLKVCENFGKMVRLDVYNDYLASSRVNENKDYDEFDIENKVPAGRRFHNDEHGNIIYHHRFSGAPILPYRMLGLCSHDFVEKYKTIPKNKRLGFINRVLKYDKDEKTIQILDILIDYEHVYPDNDNEEKLIHVLNEIVKKNVCNQSFHGRIQYKYLRIIAEKIDLQLDK
jgi:hypothetical protein